MGLMARSCVVHINIKIYATTITAISTKRVHATELRIGNGFFLTKEMIPQDVYDTVVEKNEVINRFITPNGNKYEGLMHGRMMGHAQRSEYEYGVKITDVYWAGYMIGSYSKSMDYEKNEVTHYRNIWKYETNPHMIITYTGLMRSFELLMNMLSDLSTLSHSGRYVYNNTGYVKLVSLHSVEYLINGEINVT